MSEYVPMLIVAINNDGEYVHIRDAKNDVVYTCPCCGARIKARAMESDKVQPHFYHSEGSECSEENIAHWIYKNWLFGSGCKFVINKDGKKKEYTVENVDIEKTYETKFGLYKPDITVNTTTGDTIYFEIYYSNKKDVDDYYCKWNELGNDVVEVNTRELIYSNINQSTPIFDVIYSNGEYLKKYIDKSKRDTYANTIKVYKEAIAKSECENFKKRFEQLDWFWIILQKYRLQKIAKNYILEVFTNMEFEDMNNCYNLTKRLKCIDIQLDLQNINNAKFNSIIEKYSKVKEIKIIKESKQIFCACVLTESRKNVNCYKTISFRSYNNILTYEFYKKIIDYYNVGDFKNEIQYIDDLDEYVKGCKYNYLVDIYFGDREKVEAYLLSNNNKCFYKYDYTNTGNFISNLTSFYYLQRFITNEDKIQVMNDKVQKYNDFVNYLDCNDLFLKFKNNLINKICLINNTLIVQFEKTYKSYSIILKSASNKKIYSYDLFTKDNFNTNTKNRYSYITKKMTDKAKDISIDESHKQTAFKIVTDLVYKLNESKIWSAEIVDTMIKYIIRVNITCANISHHQSYINIYVYDKPKEELKELYKKLIAKEMSMIIEKINSDKNCNMYIGGKC